MGPEYAAVRGLDASGAPTEEAWSRLGDAALLDLAAEACARDVPSEADKPEPIEVRARGRVRLRGSGPLARALGQDVVSLELDLPASLEDVLAVAAAERPNAARHLISGGEPVPAAYRRSHRLRAGDLVRDGDEIDLVVALSGGGPLS
jgi:hypothetical protein